MYGLGLCNYIMEESLSYHNGEDDKDIVLLEEIKLAFQLRVDGKLKLFLK